MIVSSMILFWTLDKHEYNTTTYEIKITDNRTLTMPEQILNYTIGIVFILLFLVSSTLNPVLFFHHVSSEKRGLTTLLFATIALSDCLTNLFTPIVYSVYLFRPQVYSLIDAVVGSFCNVSCTTGCVSVCSTTLLAITRFLKITNPFVRINGRILVKYLAVYSLSVLIVMIMLTISALTHLVSDDLVNIFITICTLTNFILIFLGVIFSVITVVYVYFFKPSSPTDHITRKVCGTILLMSSVYLITLLLSILPFLSLLNILSDVEILARNFKFLCFFFMPVLTSAWNPIIIISRSRAIRNTFLQLLRPWFVYRNIEQNELMQVN